MFAKHQELVAMHDKLEEKYLRMTKENEDNNKKIEIFKTEA